MNDAPSSWREELRETWRFFGGTKLFGVCSIVIAVLAFAEAQRQIATDWVGDHLGMVLVTALFVIAAALIGGILGLVGAAIEFRGGAAFWLGVVGSLANAAMPVCVFVLVIFTI
jgi:hypothetical protein